MRRLFIVALALACATAVQAQAPYLVTDINTSYTPNALSSSPRTFVPSGATVLFSASSDATGAELFRTNGSTVELVKDIVAGTGGSAPFNLMPLSGNTVVFAAWDAANGQELWKSDGTEAGTVLVKDIYVGGEGSAATPLAQMDGKVFFRASNASFLNDVWVTDGTESGTVKLVDSPQAGGFQVLSGFMYFYSGTTLWKSDGTPGGTTAVRTDVTIRALTVAGSRLYFAGWDTAHGYELWTSDGTAAGTNLLKDIKPGAANAFNTASTFSIVPVGANVVFFAHDFTTGWSLWRSDGTVGGTVAIVNYPTWSATTIPPFLYSAGGQAFFSLNGLWRTDGTGGGTTELGDVLDPYFFVTGASKVFFFARETTDTFRLWSTDGSDAGTSKVSAMVTPGTQPAAMAWAGGQLYFSGSDGVTGAEPWASDGTPGGTHLIANLVADPPASSTPSDLRGATGKLFFTATSSGPREIWASDGTAGGTSALTAFLGQKTFSDFAAWKGRLFFDVYTGSSTYTTYHSDGTAAGTTVLRSGPMSNPYASSGFFYFNAPPAAPDPYYSYSRPWRSDGTVAGTIDLTPPTGEIPEAPSRFVETGGLVYFEAGSPRGIWRTAGTPESTVRMTAHVTSYASMSSNLVPVNGALFYALSDVYGSELRRTSIGVYHDTSVLEIVPGPGGGQPEQLTAAGSLVFFVANDGTTGRELWRSDGTQAGTFLVKDIVSGPGSPAPASLIAVGSTLFFVASNGFDGVELWKSDGTTAGTVLVADIAPGAASSFPQYLVAADGLLWFVANDGTTGAELWMSDGTGPGTQRVADLEPGSIGSSPRFLTVAGRQLFFSAQTSAGRELWSMALAPTAYSIGDARVVEGHSGTRQLRFTVTRSGDVSAPGSVSLITSSGTATAGSDYTPQSGGVAFAAGVSQAYIDVDVNGDTTSEDDETVFVTISSPTSGAIERNVGTGVIEDDDRIVALSVVYVHVRSYSSPRTFVVTNTGPSTASGVMLRFTESPTIASFSGTNCSANGFGSVICALGSILAGESKTVTLSRSNYYYSYSNRYDPANPPGYTFTATVSSNIAETDLTDNTVSKMISNDGALLLPPFLVSSTPVTAAYLAESTSSSPRTFNVASSNAGVTATPAAPSIPAGLLATSFTLQPGAITGKTKLTLTPYPFAAELTIAIVSPGQTPKLDTMIVGGSSSSYIPYGRDLKIPVRVAARRADGTYPTGIVALLDGNSVLIEERSLNATGEVEFTRSGLQTGSYQHRVSYAGDANFNLVTVALETIYVEPVSTNMELRAPIVVCGSTVEVEATVTAYNTGSPAPTGTVTIGSVQGTLVATGEPGQSRVTLQVPVTAGTTSLYATYQPNGPFYSDTASRSISVGCASSMNLVATATATNRVQLTWNSTGATTYDVYRMSSGCCGSFSFVGYAGTASYIDTTVTPNLSYLYRVRPTGGAFSNPDIATTILFTDDPIVPQFTAVKAVHFSQLLSAVAAVRSLAGMSTFTPTPAPGFGVMIQATTITQIRTALNPARVYLGMPAFAFTDPSLAAGMAIKATHVQELRTAVK